MTKDTEKAFKILYCEYRKRRKSGMSKSSAVCFEDGALTSVNAFSKWDPADINFAMNELKKNGFIRMNILGDIQLNESGIEYMENKPKEFFREVSSLFDLSTILGWF